METIDMAVIGGGIIGLAVGYELQRNNPDKMVAVLEKSSYLGDAQSGRSSGVLHAGIPYHPGSLKAELCVKGNEMLTEFAKKYDVPVAKTGKLTVATTDDEVEKLDFYYQRACQNGVKGIKRLDSQEILQYEPNVVAKAAIYTPTTGIIEAATLTKTLEDLLEKEGGFIFKETKVEDITPNGDSFIIGVNQAGEEYEFKADLLVNAAGVYADTLAKKINPDFKHKIKSLRGEYMKFSRNGREDISMNGMNVYPVPFEIPGMYDQWGEQKVTSGTHLTPTFEIDKNGDAVVGNTVLVGPLQNLVSDKEDYSNNRKSVESFLEDVLRYFPNLSAKDLEFDFTGIQAKLVGYDDFVIERDTKHKNAIHVIADSPGLTSCLAIAEYVGNLVVQEEIDSLESLDSIVPKKIVGTSQQIAV